VAPIDVVLLVVAALALAVAVKGTLAPLWLLTTLRVLAYPMILLGVMAVASALIDMYMVRVAHVPPGEPMGLDQLAYPLREAFLDIARGVGLLIVAFFFRDYARRRKLPVGK
jgi:hypothetical protein